MRPIKLSLLSQPKGKHRFIDKVHVNYVEKDRRHWAALENFDSRRVAISEKFYRDNDRLLQGGLWCEVTIAYNEIEEDDYAFFVEDLRPIQLSRFNYEQYQEGREQVRPRYLDGRHFAVGGIGALEIRSSSEATFHRTPHAVG